MSTAIALRPAQQPAVMPVGDMMRTAEVFVKSGLFNDAKDVAKAFVKIQAGQEIGVPPFAAMRGISIIQGQAALGATLVAGRMKAHGYDWEEVRRDNEVCELKVFKPNGKVAGTSRFSMEDAKAAGLNGKDNWKKYPKSMLFARCITDAARTWAPEVFSGIPVYTAEELGADRTNEEGVAEEKPAVVEPKPQRVFDAAVMHQKIAEAVEMSGIGHHRFREILGRHGFEKLSEVSNREAGIAILSELRDAMHELQESVEQAEQEVQA